MRTPVVLIILFLIVGVAAITMWPFTLPIPFEPSVPGQYNLHESRPTWPATERVAPYKPGPGMGSNRVA
jgi:hypothetical protein